MANRSFFLSFSVSFLTGLLSAAALFAQDYSPPEGYYDDAEGLTGPALREALHGTIDGHNVINYSAGLPALWEVTEADPDNPGNILLIYSGASVAPTPGEGGWNREHSWPRSYGAEEGSHAFSDAHHMYPCDEDVNTTRLNYIFDYAVVRTPVPEAPGSFADHARDIFEPRDEDKGRIARSQLYMDLRYDSTDPEGDLNLSDFPNTSQLRFAKKTTLLEWNRLFPPDERERKRNHSIHNGVFSNNRFVWQGNRNPFIDFPELGDAIHTAGDYISWGSWRIEHFSFDELSDPAVSGALQDPDLDGVANLVELSHGGDPRDPSPGDWPEVRTSDQDGTREFAFTRIRRANISFMEISVEESMFPTSGTDWQAVVLDEQNSTAVRDGLVEDVVVMDAALTAGVRQRHFRLKVSQDRPGADTVDAVFDPVRQAEPDSLSPFLYAPHVAADWAESDWYGMVSDNGYPWLYHPAHAWVFGTGQNEENLYLFDEGIGWYWTGYHAYPYLFSLTLSKWLYFHEQSQAPNRTFTDVETGLEVSEQSII